MHDMQTHGHAGYYRKTKVLGLLGDIAPSTLYRWEKAGQFPARVHLGPVMVAWRVAEVDAWLASRPPIETGDRPSPSRFVRPRKLTNRRVNGRD
jgi:predicted DNA-binding transcriptional regulator AlpA